MGGAMSSIVISGDTSGAITLAAPAVSGTNTLTLPALTGTVTTDKTVGTVLQVVSATYSTSTTTTGGTFISSGLSATITPKFSTSKILVIADMAGLYNGDNNSTGVSLAIIRGSTNIITFAAFTNYIASSVTLLTAAGTNYLDSPATTSATTYNVQFKRVGSAGTAGVQANSDTSTLTLMEIAG